VELSYSGNACLEWMISVIFLSVFLGLLLALLILAGGAFVFSSASLNELWEEESWVEPVVYAMLACLAALLLSFVNVRVLGDPVPISLNVTGVFIPLSISLMLIILRKVNLLATFFSVVLVSICAFLLAGVGPDGIGISFPFWLVPSGVAGLCGYYFSSRRNLLEMAALAYAASSIGILIGGDLAHIPAFAASSGNGFVLGAGGIADFVFLAGVVSIAILGTGQIAFAAIRKRQSDVAIGIDSY
jgi:hypothetical protein